MRVHHKLQLLLNQCFLFKHAWHTFVNVHAMRILQTTKNQRKKNKTNPMNIIECRRDKLIDAQIENIPPNKKKKKQKEAKPLNECCRACVSVCITHCLFTVSNWKVAAAAKQRTDNHFELSPTQNSSIIMEKNKMCFICWFFARSPAAQIVCAYCCSSMSTAIYVCWNHNHRRWVCQVVLYNNNNNNKNPRNKVKIHINNNKQKKENVPKMVFIVLHI